MKQHLSRIRRKLSGGRNRKRSQAHVKVRMDASLGSVRASVLGMGRWAGRVVPYLVIALFAASVPPLLVYGYRFVTNAEEFAAKRVVVSGNDRLSPEQVLAVAGVNHGPNVLTLNLRDLSQRLSEHPWIEYTSPYADPRWAFVTIDPKGELRIEGATAELAPPIVFLLFVFGT